MSPHQILRHLSLALCTLLLAGCVSNRMYRSKPDEFVIDNLSTNDAADASVAFIEFDDHGELWDPHQMMAAVEHIRRKSESSPNGAIVITYIHGWRNNASQTQELKGHLGAFKNMLLDIAMAERGANPQLGHFARAEPARPVVGVFLGWRGRTVVVPPFDHASFWRRREVATRMPSISLTEVVGRIVQVSKKKHGSKLILAGHSLGGMILEQNIAQLIVPMLMMRGVEGFDWPIDLVLLVNPASSALTAKKLVDIMTRCGARVELTDDRGMIQEVDRPLIVSMTSESDWVTRKVLPGSLYMGAATSATRDYDGSDVPHQRPFVYKAPGHTPYLFSHEIITDGGEDHVVRLEDSHNATPSWIMRIPREILDGHSDIFNPRFLGLVVRVINETLVTDPQLRVRVYTDTLAESELSGP